MFQELQKRLDQAFRKLAGQDRLTEESVKEALREVRVALLEADVDFAVARDFVGRVKEQALGQPVAAGLTPAQHVVKIVHDELVTLLGGQARELNLGQRPVATLMVMGLQGSGKTTFCGKLAKLLVAEGRQPLLVAGDIYRPAAIDQLHTLGEALGVPVHSDRESRNPAQIVKLGLRRARDKGCDVLIVDTAGRLHVDDTLMQELVAIDRAVPMHEKLLVLDAMTGQEAVRIAQEFAGKVGFDGVVLTKLDGDARGGAALSVLQVTGKPVKLVGVGEKLEDLEVFHPDRMAGRILGMGDVLSLIEKAERSMDLDEAEDLAQRFTDGQFTLEDFQRQIRQMRRMGPLQGVLKMLPGLGGAALDKANLDESQLSRVEAIINSMTRQERRHPDVINGSRRKRIARGSGTNVSQVNRLLKQYRDMRRMMKEINSAGGLQEFSRRVLERR
ncbi:MAG: signal recognition particle protein [Candidatus Krumholzibacteriia bacterium]